jgi:peptide-methionine (R)-S-oxide reductase
MAKIEKSDAEWRQSLSPEQYRVLRKHGTERSGSSPLDKNYAPGT